MRHQSAKKRFVNLVAWQANEIRKQHPSLGEEMAKRAEIRANSQPKSFEVRYNNGDNEWMLIEDHNNVIFRSEDRDEVMKEYEKKCEEWKDVLEAW